MSDDHEWGPWIEHDGAHIPTDFGVGDLVQLTSEDNRTGDLLTSAKIVEPFDFVRWNWFWGESTHDALRYRIRKPRALLDLIKRAKELDDAPEGPVHAPAAPKVPA